MQQVLNWIDNTSAKATAAGAGAAGLAQNIQALNAAYQSGKISANDVKKIANKMGL